MNVGRLLILFMVVLLMVFGVSYNLYTYEFNKNYVEIESSIKYDLDSLKSENLTTGQRIKLDTIEKKIQFMNGLCFKEVEN
jgi:hypothetical protein